MRVAALATLGLLSLPVRSDTVISYEMRPIGDHRGEGCAVADFSNNGELDVVGLPFLCLAPPYAPVRIREVKGDVDHEGKGCCWDLMNGRLDANGEDVGSAMTLPLVDIDDGGDLDIVVTRKWCGPVVFRNRRCGG